MNIQAYFKMVLYPSSSKKPGGIFLLYLLWESGIFLEVKLTVLTVTEFAWCLLTLRLSALSLQQFVKLQCRFPVPALMSALVSQALYLLVSLHLGSRCLPYVLPSPVDPGRVNYSVCSAFTYSNGMVTSKLLICETGHLVYLKTQ